MLHSGLSGDMLHTPLRWIVADATARGALSVTESDLNKFAVQEDDYSLWMLTDVSPSVVWEQVGGSNLDAASQAEAEAGTENTHYMTALRVAQALAALGGGGSLHVVRITSTQDWTVAASTAFVRVKGGGAGGGGATSSGAAGGGGEGGESHKVVTGLTVGNTVTCTVGTGGPGGAGGVSPRAGYGGGTSSFGAHCSATGGGGGSAGNGDGGLGGAPGVGSGGDADLYGGGGHVGVINTTKTGGNGGGASGGRGKTTAAGEAGYNGCGGGGGGGGAGGAGGDGYIEIWYVA